MCLELKVDKGNLKLNLYQDKSLKNIELYNIV